MRARWMRAASACALLGACAPADTRPVGIGAPAPPYSAVTLAGDSVSIAGLRGNVVLLNIWATWCHPCRKEIPLLQSLHEQYAPLGLRIVGVSVDSPGEGTRIAAFGREFGMTYPIWHDPDDRVSAAYQAFGVPATYLIDRTGVLRWLRVGEIIASDPSLVREIEQALGAPAAGPD